MASVSSSDSLKSLCECPVCFEPYKDPRLLKCGHQFCEKCLKDIAERHPQGHAKCPVCRDVTTLQHGDVTTLPRATLLTYIQDLVFRQPTEEALGQKCSKCKVNKPSRHCPECSADLAYLCDQCFTVHQKVKRFAQHETVKFDPLLICPDHKHKMVENFCQTCNKPTCVECLFEVHLNHQIEPLDEVAARARKKLQNYVTTYKDKVINMDSMSHINIIKQKLEKGNKQIEDTLRGIRESWNKFGEKLSAIEEQAKTLLLKESTKLANFDRKVKEVHAAQEKMLKLCESLSSSGVSDPQVIIGARDLQQPDIDMAEVQVNVPIIGEDFRRIDKNVEELSKSLDFSSTVETIRVERRVTERPWNLQAHRQIPVIGQLQGICFSKTKNTIVVRDADKEHQIKIYRNDGTLITQFGDSSLSLPDGYLYQISGICVDTSRDLILLPNNDGTLIRMEMDERMKDKTRLGHNLCGVDYIPGQDLYVLSDYVLGKSSVILVSADSLSVVRSIGEGTFSLPLNVCGGEIDGCTTIVVSDYGKDKLSQYSVAGELLREYGPDIGELGKLSRPMGVAVNNRGGVIVCNQRNFRVLRVWREKGEEHWECLLDQAQLGEQPWCIGLNDRQRYLGVGHGNLRLFTY